MSAKRVKHLFNRFSHQVTIGAGSPFAFVIASVGVFGWVIGGFFIGFSNNTYQLAINTITTIVTFLMVFLIQSAQNRDSAALHLKLDELIASSEKARNLFLRTDGMTDEEVCELKKEFEAMEDRLEDEIRES